MRSLLLMSMLALSLGIAEAEAASVKMSLGDAEQALSAIAALSAGKDVVVGEAAAAKTLKQPYAGWSLPTLTALSRDMGALRNAVLPYAEGREQRRQALAGPDGILSAAAQAELDADIAKQRREAVEVEVTRFAIADLKPEKNDILNGPAILAALAPLLDDSEKR